MSTLRPTAQDVAEAQRILGVRPGASRASVLEAWRCAVRANHPDAAPEGERALAEARCSRINAAKDLLLANVESPARPPQGGGPPPSGAGTDRPRTGAGPSRAPRSRPDPPRSTAPATGLLIVVLVVCVIGALGVLAITTRSSDTPGEGASRIGDTPTEAGSLATTASSLPPGVALPADSPEAAMQMLLFAVQNGSGPMLNALLHPEARTAELEDVLARLRQPDHLQLTRAAETVDCRLSQRDLPDRSYCDAEVPDGLLPQRLEFRRTGAGWRLVGYARTV